MDMGQYKASGGTVTNMTVWWNVRKLESAKIHRRQVALAVLQERRAAEALHDALQSSYDDVSDGAAIALARFRRSCHSTGRPR